MTDPDPRMSEILAQVATAHVRSRRRLVNESAAALATIALGTAVIAYLLGLAPAWVMLTALALLAGTLYGVWRAHQAEATKRRAATDEAAQKMREHVQGRR